MKRLIAFIIFSSLAIFSHAQHKRMAVVELSAVYMRQLPDYESALETQELMGTVVELTGEEGYWREILSPQPYKAWVTEKGLVEMSEEQIEDYKKAEKVMFTDLYGHIHSAPERKSPTICDLVAGDIMRITGQKRKAGRWVEVILPSGRRGWVRKAGIKRHEGFTNIVKGDERTDIPKEKIESIIAEAEKLLGVPYLWGGMTPKGVDCSGLIRLSFMMNGYLLPRNASQQVTCGREVSLDSLKRGDLVFFGTPAGDGKGERITHVGMYLGNDKIIHSSHLVRINSLTPGTTDHYENSHRLIRARRLSGQ